MPHHPPEVGEDRLVAEERGAELIRDGVPDPVRVTHGDRVVEVLAVLDVLDRLLGDVRIQQRSASGSPDTATNVKTRKLAATSTTTLYRSLLITYVEHSSPPYLRRSPRPRQQAGAGRSRAGHAGLHVRSRRSRSEPGPGARAFQVSPAGSVEVVALQLSPRIVKTGRDEHRDGRDVLHHHGLGLVQELRPLVLVES